MISEENHPQMIQAHHELLQALGKTLGLGGRTLDRRMLHDQFEVVKAHCQKWRSRGVDFPALVAVTIPHLGIIQWKRADLDLAQLRIHIINFVRENPRATMREVAAAFRAAYPSLKPDDILEKVDQGERANEHREERRVEIAKDASVEVGIDPEAPDPKTNS